MQGDDPVVGKLGTVTHPIVAGRPGEIVVRIRGGTETYMAVADEDLPAKTEVLVLAKLSNRTVEVTRFSS
jgi:membrane protein implicated in regulation of membrane protease activity